MEERGGEQYIELVYYHLHIIPQVQDMKFLT